MKTDAVRTQSSCFNRSFDRKSGGIVTASLFSSPSDLLENSWLSGESRRKGVPLAVSSHTLSRSTELCDDQLTSPSVLPPSPPPDRAIVVSGLPHGVASDAICTTAPGLPPLLERTYGIRSFPPLLERTYGVLGFWPKTTTLLHTPRPVLGHRIQRRVRFSLGRKIWALTNRYG